MKLSNSYFILAVLFAGVEIFFHFQKERLLTILCGAIAFIYLLLTIYYTNQENKEKIKLINEASENGNKL